MRDRVSAVLFDLGNTLAGYYRREDFPPILERAVRSVLEEIEFRGLSSAGFEASFASALLENRESRDFRVRPLAERLVRVFGLETDRADLLQALCHRFMEPLLATGRRFDDALPALDQLRRAGCPTAIVSNSPWGSSAELWREELRRLELLDAVDAAVFCGDVGWRKPAREIFEFAAARLQVAPDACVFIGDDLEWDIDGATRAGMRPILLDRDDRFPAYAGERVPDLARIMEHLF